LNTGIVYNSQAEASRQTNINKTLINKCLKKKISFAGKHPETGEPLRWEYVA
jgi:hypothetical protein